MSCTYPNCNCGHDPVAAMNECWSKFCAWHCYSPDDKELYESFCKDWRKQLKSKARKGRATIHKDFQRHLVH